MYMYLKSRFKCSLDNGPGRQPDVPVLHDPLCELPPNQLHGQLELTLQLTKTLVKQLPIPLDKLSISLHLSYKIHVIECVQ